MLGQTWCHFKFLPFLVECKQYQVKYSSALGTKYYTRRSLKLFVHLGPELHLKRVVIDNTLSHVYKWAQLPMPPLIHSYSTGFRHVLIESWNIKVHYTFLPFIARSRSCDHRAPRADLLRASGQRLLVTWLRSPITTLMISSVACEAQRRFYLVIRKLHNDPLETCLQQSGSHAAFLNRPNCALLSSRWSYCRQFKHNGTNVAYETHQSDTLMFVVPLLPHIRWAGRPIGRDKQDIFSLVHATKVGLVDITRLEW